MDTGHWYIHVHLVRLHVLCRSMTSILKCILVVSKNTKGTVFLSIVVLKKADVVQKVQYICLKKGDVVIVQKVQYP